MVRLTTEATRFIQHLRRDLQVRVDEAPRLFAEDSQVKLTFTDLPSRADRVMVAGGMILFVASEVDHALERATIDARAEGDETILVIREPRIMPPGIDRLQ